MTFSAVVVSPMFILVWLALNFPVDMRLVHDFPSNLLLESLTPPPLIISGSILNDQLLPVVFHFTIQGLNYLKKQSKVSEASFPFICYLWRGLKS